MKTKLLICITLIGLIACSEKKEKFQLKGSISNAEEKTLFLEHTALKGVQIIDSVKLSKEGKFSFSTARPDYPDFYQLRIDKSTIKFAVDSTESIQINAALPNFSTQYSIEGSKDSEAIKELRLSVMNIQNKVNALKSSSEEEKNEALTALEQEIERHKALAQKIILQAPASTSAYFALFQKINGLYIFSPFNKEDYRLYAAVATAYEIHMPAYERTVSLKNLTLSALKERREAAKQEKKLEELLSNAKEQVGYIDISLPNRYGKERKLSELEGKIVIIDFSVYETKESSAHTFLLRDLYKNYHDAGLEIYQISLDKNQILWEVASENVPWICVRDRESIYSRYAKLYNVQSLPTLFLMDRKGEIIGRNLPIEKMVTEIEKMIK